MTKTSHFFSLPTTVLLNAIHFSIWLNLHTTVDPSAALQWKEKKRKRKRKEKQKTALYFVLQHSLHCLESTAPIGYKT